MFPLWRLRLREARAAIGGGRWDEAAALLASPALREFLPVKLLSQELAQRLVERAGRRIAGGQSVAGWRDLAQAERLGADEAEVDRFRREMATRRLDDAVQLLAHGDAGSALAALDRLPDRGLAHRHAEAWRRVAEAMDHAEGRAVRGDLAVAITSYERALRATPSDVPESAAVVASLQERLKSLHAAAPELARLEGQLHAAIEAARWSDALTLADAVLELAPQHAASRQARQRAWKAVDMETTLAYIPKPGRRLPTPWAVRNGGPTRAVRAVPNGGGASRTSTHAGRSYAETDTVADPAARPPRLIAWIDAVGGYLLCLGDEISLGQPSPDGTTDVPILADLSRRHAVIRREGDAYVLTPVGPTAVDGRRLRDSIVLRDGQIITLGSSVQLKFRKPHALSGTAVLELATHHKTEPAVDGVILMSESCILGPQSSCHVPCPRWPGDAVLYRRGDELHIRRQTPMSVDGAEPTLQAVVRAGSRVEGDDFALSFEAV
jgi:tetratricopeptide (TPR) repeat protein